MYHVPARILAGMALAVSLVSCGTVQRAAPSSSHSRHPSVAVMTTSASSPSKRSVIGPCHARSLTMQLVADGAATGSMVRVYQFTNGGSATCSLYGYPHFQLEASPGHPLPTSVSQQPAAFDQITLNDGSLLVTPSTEQTVDVPPGGHAWEELWYSDGNQGTQVCPTSHLMVVTLPHSAGSMTLTGSAGTIQAYGSPCGTLYIQPVTSRVGS